MRGITKEQIGISIDGIPNGSTLSTAAPCRPGFWIRPNLLQIDVSQSPVTSHSVQPVAGRLHRLQKTRDPSRTPAATPRSQAATIAISASSSASTPGSSVLPSPLCRRVPIPSCEPGPATSREGAGKTMQTCASSRISTMAPACGAPLAITACPTTTTMRSRCVRLAVQSRIRVDRRLTGSPTVGTGNPQSTR